MFLVFIVHAAAGKVLPKRGRLLNRGEIRLEIDGRLSPEVLGSMGSARAQASFMRRYYERRYEELEELVIRG